MRKSKYQITWLALLVFMATIPTLALANDYYLNHTTSPQVTDMFRYGNVETSLFTGKLNLAIPIYQLEDPDFKLNIALQYNSEGFKPRKHSGYIGYNWFLEAGGCITREVRNIPDEYLRTYSGNMDRLPEIGMYYLLNDTTNAKKIDKNKVYLFDPSIVEYCGERLSYNLLDCTADRDYLPDIYHFKFCGYSGSFMINNQGKPIVLEGDFVEVVLPDLENKVLGCTSMLAPVEYSQISIKTTDGYTYLFGGDISTIEYTMSATKSNIPDQLPPIINTWFLKKIIAPNQRTATFYYKGSFNSVPHAYDTLWTYNEYYDYFEDRDQTIEIKPNIFSWYKCRTLKSSMTKECIIDSIVISGGHDLHVSFHNSSYQYTLYRHSTNALGRFNYKLDSIIVKSDNRVLKKAHLESSYKGHDSGAHYWRFLTSVEVSDEGVYKLKYNYSLSYPHLYDSGSMDYHISDFYGYCKSNTLENMLQEILYPTGGKQIFTFESHDCGIERRYKKYCTEDIELTSAIKSNDRVSGVRIKRIETYLNGTLIETKNYSYKQKSTNRSSGIYYNQILIYFATDSTKGFFTNNCGCYSLLDSHIGYSYVEETTKNTESMEEFKIGYTFNTGRSTYCSLTDPTINKQADANTDLLYFILSGLLTFDNKLTKIGYLRLIEYYKNSTLTQSTQFEYNGIENLTTELIPQVPSALGCTDTVVVFSHYFAPISRKLFVCPHVLTQKIVKDYGSDGQFLISSTNYTYDSKFRIKKETTTNSDGTKHFIKHTYIDDLQTPQWYDGTFAPNPYAVLLETNQIDKPIETTLGYIDNGQEYITGGKVNLYGMVLHADFPKNISSRSLPPTFPLDSLEMIPDSMMIHITGSHLSLHQTLNLSLAKGVQDYQPIFSNGDTISYDNRYRLTCGYTFDEMNRLLRIAPYGKLQTTYTWDGIYPISKTTGNQTSTYTYIPYVGMSSMTDARGVTTYYEYDKYGRLIEVYRLSDGKKEILNKYIYHIKSEPQL